MEIQGVEIQNSIDGQSNQLEFDEEGYQLKYQVSGNQQQAVQQNQNVSPQRLRFQRNVLFVFLLFLFLVVVFFSQELCSFSSVRNQVKGFQGDQDFSQREEDIKSLEQQLKQSEDRLFQQQQDFVEKQRQKEIDFELQKEQIKKQSTFQDFEYVLKEKEKQIQSEKKRVQDLLIQIEKFKQQESWKEKQVTSNISVKVISSKEYLFQILDLAYSYEPDFATDLVKPVKGEIRRHWGNFMKLVEEKNFRYEKTVHGGGGRGIVFSALSSQIEKALFNIDVLRQNGINLPVQVFWNGKLLRNSQLKMFEKREGVTLVEMNDFFPQMNRIDNHFLYKYIPIFTTNFDEVLFLDIDNFPISDPAPLFDLLAEKNVSALFWPDLHYLNPENPFWEELGGFPDNQFNFTQESGQIVLNREKCFWPLALSTFFNVKHKIYFKTAYIAKKPGEFMKGVGDKELFHIAWKALQQKYLMMPPPAQINAIRTNCGIGQFQNDFNDKGIFFHHNSYKMNNIKEIVDKFKKLNTTQKPEKCARIKEYNATLGLEVVIQVLNTEGIKQCIKRDHFPTYYVYDCKNKSEYIDFAQWTNLAMTLQQEITQSIAQYD